MKPRSAAHLLPLLARPEGRIVQCAGGGVNLAIPACTWKARVQQIRTPAEKACNKGLQVGGTQWESSATARMPVCSHLTQCGQGLWLTWQANGTMTGLLLLLPPPLLLLLSLLLPPAAFALKAPPFLLLPALLVLLRLPPRPDLPPFAPPICLARGFAGLPAAALLPPAAASSAAPASAAAASTSLPAASGNCTSKA